MHRKKLLRLLEKYKPFDAHESEMRDRMIDFVKRVGDCFDNFYEEGHITASAWIFNKESKKVGLIHHGLINKWLQPGGHSDRNPDTPQEAFREAQEEFGIEGLELDSENIFDIDIHLIKEDKKRNLGEHYHFDVRFLVLGDSKILPKVSNESTDVKWVNLTNVMNLNNEEGIKRMVAKTQDLIRTN
jgi:8-oxo-dGTP pyrophosphatase MutT (NUDIX family)